MSILLESLTESPGRYLEKVPVGTYVRVSELPGSTSAAKSAASRAAARGELSHVSKGLYYKGAKTRYGSLTPPVEDVAREVLGSAGVGPAGVSAARALGLTTQIPATTELVTIARVPEGLRHVRVSTRSNVARLDLTYIEIAVLEVLRTWRTTVDGGWSATVAAIAALVADGTVRLDALRRAAAREHHRELRDRMRDLLGELAATERSAA